MSLWSSSSDDKAAAAQPDSLAAGEGFLDAAGGAADSVSAAAAAGTMADPLGAGLFSASAIVAAAAGAEGDVLAAAAEDSWLGTQLVQRLLTTIHDASGLPWWQSIVLCTLAMRLATLPVMIMQIKNTHRMSQVRTGWGGVGCGWVGAGCGRREWLLVCVQRRQAGGQIVQPCMRSLTCTAKQWERPDAPALPPTNPTNQPTGTARDGAAHGVHERGTGTRQHRRRGE